MNLLDIPGFSWSAPCAAGSGTLKYRAVSLDNTGKVIWPAAAYKKIIGVAYNEPTVTGEATTIVSSGIVIVDAAGVDDAGSPANTAIAIGDLVTARSSDGKFVKAVPTAGSSVAGIVVGGSVTSAGTGQLSVLLFSNIV